MPRSDEIPEFDFDSIHKKMVDQNPTGNPFEAELLDKIGDTKKQRLTNVKIEESGQLSGPARLQQKKDHRTLARFYGFCLATLGFISLIPAVIMLIKINQGEVASVTPRWIYILMFVGAIHVVYAFYLSQVADWSALWAISILMLVATCLYALFSTAILLDDGFGPVIRFLQLPVAQMRSASIWCLIGLCLSVLMSFLCGRESLQWKRNERIMIEASLLRQQKQKLVQANVSGPSVR